VADDDAFKRTVAKKRKSGDIRGPEAVLADTRPQNSAEADYDAVPASTDLPAHFAEAATSPAVESDIITAPAAEPMRAAEEMIDMATVATPTEATDKAEAVFGDFSTRVKSAFEKSSKFGEEMVDFAKGNVEAMIASARVAAKAGESFGQEAADYGKKSFESASTAFKSFATVKSPTELFQLQSEYAKASFDSAVSEASRVSESLLKVAGEIAQPLSNRYAIAAEKIKATSL
jgi:phasin family protein